MQKNKNELGDKMNEFNEPFLKFLENEANKQSKSDISSRLRKVIAGLQNSDDVGGFAIAIIKCVAIKMKEDLSLLFVHFSVSF